MTALRLLIVAGALLFGGCSSSVRFSQIPPTPAAPENFRLGLDNLISENFKGIVGKRVALLTNSAGRASDLLSSFDIFRTATSFHLVSVFTPEHGFDAAITAGNAVSNDTLDRIPIISLYGKYRRPTAEMLSGCDIVVADIQDVGLRSYTFAATMRNVMDACAEYNKQIVVLDRPNPLGGMLVDGSPADTSLLSFVAPLPIPYIHGCTIGELALMMNGENWLPSKKKVRLTVVPMTGWKRFMTWENISLAWLPTSPNVPSPETIRAMAITGLLGEAGGVSIGIGTALPFRFLGRPDALGAEIISKIDDLKLPCKTAKVRFLPEKGAFSGQICTGIMLAPGSGQQRYFSAGIMLLAALRPLLPAIDQNLRKNDSMLRKALADNKLCDALINGENPEKILKIAVEGEIEFRKLRQKYLLYGD